MMELIEIRVGEGRSRAVGAAIVSGRLASPDKQESGAAEKAAMALVSSRKLSRCTPNSKTGTSRHDSHTQAWRVSEAQDPAGLGEA
jgi:hypothetical protein